MSSDETISELLAGLQECDDPATFLAKAKKAHPELAEDLDRHAALLELLDDVVQHEAEGVPPQIGPYRIIDFLARGGMGSVYLAEQEKPLRRRVALKILSSHVDRPEARARFDVERSVLSRMDHPNIARVFDAGPLPDGRPYVVMEYVDGPPLTEYCEQQGLDLESRLELFVDVCEAVAYAHQKGVIHRDVKPSNVLVAEIDGRPIPKVIDFGLAKPLTSEDEIHDVTVRGQVLGTPAYMSPEQAGGNPEVDVRTDVYALGVLLYELLVGEVPWGRDTLSRVGAAVIIRRILEEEPPRPSTRLSTMANSLDGTGDVDGSTHDWARRLRGDLDWITMRALEKDPARRYATVHDLAEDVRRHLRHEPVDAGPPSATYRARKFVRRHVAAVAAAAGIALALLGGLVVSHGHYREAERAREDAEAHAALERDARLTAEAAETAAERALLEKEAEARKAWVARDFLREMFAEVRPSYHGSDARLLDVLTPAGERLATALPDDPEIQATLHAILGSTHLQLGAVDEAQLHLGRAVALRNEALGEKHADTTEVRIRHAVALTQGNRLAEAADALRMARVALDDLDNAPLELSAALLEAEANLAMSAGETEEAAKLYRQALAVTEERFPGASMRTLPARHGLARALQGQGDTDGAAAHLEELVALAPEFLQENDPRLYAIQLDWVRHLNDRGDHATASETARSVLRSVQRLAGPSHPHALTAIEELARALKGHGEDEAAGMLEQRLTALRGQGPDGPPPLGELGLKEAARIREIADALRAQGDATGALEKYAVARGLLATHLGQADDRAVREALIGVLEDMAHTSGSLQNHARSVSLHAVAVQHRRVLVATHPPEEELRRYLGNGLVNSGLALRTAGRLEEALTRVREGRHVLAALVRDEPTQFEPKFLLANAAHHEAAIHADRKDLDASLAVALEAATQFEALVDVDETPGRSHLAAATAHSMTGALFNRLGRRGEAREAYVAAVEHYRAIPQTTPDASGRHAIAFAEALLQLAFLQSTRRLDVNNAGVLRREAIAELEGVRDRTTRREEWRLVMNRARRALGFQLLTEDDPEAARACFAKWIAEWEGEDDTQDDPEHVSRGADYFQGLGRAYVRLGRTQDAQECFTRTIELRERLVAMERDPLANSRDLAQTWVLIGDSQLFETTQGVRRVAEAQSALPAYDKALETLERLLPDHPQVRADQVHPLIHRARAWLALGRPSAAVADLTAAVEAGRAALAEDPSSRVIRQHLTVAGAILAKVYVSTGELDEACRVLHEQAEAAAQLADQSPGSIELRAHVFQFQGSLLRQLGDLGRMEEADAVFESFLEAWAPAWERWASSAGGRSRLSRFLYDLAQAAAPLGLPLQEATRLAVDACETSAEHVAGDPDDTASVFALLDSIATAAFCTLQTQEHETTIRWAKRGLELLSPLLGASPDDPKLLETAWVLESKIAQASSRDRDYSEAIRARAQVLTHIRHAHSLHPSPKLQEDIRESEGVQARNLLDWSTALAQAGSHDAACGAAREGMQIMDGLHENGYMGEDGHISFAAVSHRNCALSQLALGRPEQALEHWKQVGSLLEQGSRLVQDQPVPAGAQATHYRPLLEAMLANRPQVDAAIRDLELTLGLRDPASPKEHAQRAESSLQEKAYHAAVHHFMEAFKAPAFAAHGPHLYNAACAASLRSTQLQADEAARLRTQAMDWLRRGLDAYRKDAQDPADLEKFLAWAREGDPDLAVLRGTPAFDALFVQAAQPAPAKASGE